MEEVKGIRPAVASTKEKLMDNDLVLYSGEICIHKESTQLYLTDFSIANGMGGVIRPIQTLDMALTNNGNILINNGKILFKS